jgi:hypothetical protein
MRLNGSCRQAPEAFIGRALSLFDFSERYLNSRFKTGSIGRANNAHGQTLNWLHENSSRQAGAE